MGRKSKYDPETFPKLVEMYAFEGMLEKDIAKKLGVSHESFNQYKKKFPEFLEALTRGKAPVDFEVDMALLKRAKGFEHTYKSQRVTKDGQVIEYEITQYYPPDTQAIQFWNTNRRNDKWKRNPDLKNDENESFETIDFEYQEA